RSSWSRSCSRAARTAEPPRSNANENASPVEARSESEQAHELTRLQTAIAPHLVEQDRDGRGGGVSEPIDVRGHALGSDPEPLAHGIVDALVRLVRDEPVHVAHAHARCFAHR